MTTPIRRVPPIRAVVPPTPAAPVIPAKTKPSRAGSPIAPEVSGASRQKWEDAERRPLDGLHVSLPISPLLPDDQHTDGEQDSPSGEDESSASGDAVLQPYQPAQTGRGIQSLRQEHSLTPESGEKPPRQIVQLAGLITAFALHSMAQGAWAARVPLAESILTDAVLHLNCAQNILTLRFDTTEWGSRYLIDSHSDDLLVLLRKALPMLSAVYLLAQ